jgi:hypothetical protein
MILFDKRICNYAYVFEINEMCKGCNLLSERLNVEADVNAESDDTDDQALVISQFKGTFQLL